MVTRCGSFRERIHYINRLESYTKFKLANASHASSSILTVFGDAETARLDGSFHGFYRVGGNGGGRASRISPCSSSDGRLLVGAGRLGAAAAFVASPAIRTPLPQTPDAVAKRLLEGLPTRHGRIVVG